jgi:hypothetical protein
VGVTLRSYSNLIGQSAIEFDGSPLHSGNPFFHPFQTLFQARTGRGLSESFEPQTRASGNFNLTRSGHERSVAPRPACKPTRYPGEDAGMTELLSRLMYSNNRGHKAGNLE